MFNQTGIVWIHSISLHNIFVSSLHFVIFYRRNIHVVPSTMMKHYKYKQLSFPTPSGAVGLRVSLLICGVIYAIHPFRPSLYFNSNALLEFVRS